MDFVALWPFVIFMIELIRDLASLIGGVVLIMVGLMISFTLIGAFLGIPLALLGFFLVIRIGFRISQNGL